MLIFASTSGIEESFITGFSFFAIENCLLTVTLSSDDAFSTNYGTNQQISNTVAQ